MSAFHAEHWRSVEEGNTPRRGEFKVYTTSTRAAEGAALLAVDADGNRHLLLPIRSGIAVESDERSSGVQIVGRELVEGADTTSFVDIVCRKPHLFAVFEYFAEELLTELGSDPNRPATVARKTLHRWRELFDRAPPGLLGVDELTGLFGELYLLDQLVSHDPAALKHWTGPLSSRFDFQCERVALEVKSSTTSERVVVHVHGVDQLEAPEHGELYLAVTGLERAPGGMSVPDLIEKIRTSGVDGLTLTSKLRGIGYVEQDAKHYADLRFTVRSLTMYRVDSSFPKVVRSSFVNGRLPEGVFDLRYAIELGAGTATLDKGAEQHVLNCFRSGVEGSG